MKIKDLKSGNFDVITGEITDKQEPREVTSRFSGNITVANFTLKDDTGQIKISLWGDDINKVNTGDKIKIENGWASMFRDELQVSLGRNGKLTVE